MVRTYWESWCEQPSDGAVHVVGIDDVLLVRSPPGLRARLEAAAPTTADALVDALGVPTARHGASRLTYVTRDTFRRRLSDRAERVDAEDPRVTALRDAVNRLEWWESMGEEWWNLSWALIVDGAAVVLAAYDVWDDTIAHVAVFTASGGTFARAGRRRTRPPRSTRRSPRDWCRSGGHASRTPRSLRVAEKLGFVALGWQLYAAGLM